MNVEASKRVLVYGDSFVFGKASGKNQRLEPSVRFTGVLQTCLGSRYEIIEEGLRARTLEGENAFFADRNGLAQFNSIVGSHLPVGLVVLFLGTNDCNSKSNRLPRQIAQSLKKYPEVIQEWCKFLDVSIPKLLIVAPPNINEDYYDHGARAIFGPGAGEKVRALPALYKSVTQELNVHFFDSSAVVVPAQGDGVHLDEQNNRLLGEALAENIGTLL